MRFGEGWQVVAHRGGGHLRPENTLAAFRNAMDVGSDALEMDVHATADGTLVVMHDETVERTTNGTGLIRDLTIEEIRTLDAGFNWSPPQSRGEHPFRGAGITIPTMEEVIAEFPGVPMIIDLKQRAPSIVDLFGNLHRSRDRAGHTMVASFDETTLSHFRSRFPEFHTSGTPREVVRFLLFRQFGTWACPRSPRGFQIPEKQGAIRVLTRGFVRSAHKQKISVHVWTVNSEDDMARVLETGIDGIISDRPDLVRKVIGDMQTR